MSLIRNSCENRYKYSVLLHKQTNFFRRFIIASLKTVYYVNVYGIHQRQLWCLAVVLRAHTRKYFPSRNLVRTSNYRFMDARREMLANSDGVGYHPPSSAFICYRLGMVTNECVICVELRVAAKLGGVLERIRFTREKRINRVCRKRKNAIHATLILCRNK